MELGPLSTSSWFQHGESEVSSDRPSTSATFVSARSSVSGRGNQHASTAGDFPSPSELLPVLVDALAPHNDVDTLAAAVLQIALLVDGSTTEEAEAMGAALRDGDGLARLVNLIRHADSRVHQSALLVIGNFAASEVDSRAELTLQRLRNLGTFASLLPHARSHTPLTVTYALGAIRNTCTTVEDVGLLRSTGTLARIQELATSDNNASTGDSSGMDNPRLKQFAVGCIINVRQITQATHAPQVSGPST